MLWYFPWSENIKKRACRYLLQRYLGNFLEEKLTLDQLSVDLYNGTGTVLDVSLDCEAINELGDAQSWPLEIVDGYMQKISVSIPWSTILKDDSLVEIHGLSITVKPKLRVENGSSMLESMWSSMSSSMQLAAECLQQENTPTEAAPLEGIEMFAHAIDSVLSKVKVKLINTKIRVEHVPKESETGIALEIHIKNIDYLDEAGLEPPPDLNDTEKSKTYVVATFSSKKLSFEGVTFYTNEYPAKSRTINRSLIMERSQTIQPKEDVNIESVTSDAFFESCMSFEDKPQEPSLFNDTTPQCMDKQKEEHSIEYELYKKDEKIRNEIIMFGKLTGRQELHLKMKLSLEATGSKVDLQMTFGSLVLFLSPRQLHLLIDLASGLSSPQREDVSRNPLNQSELNACKPMRAADFERVEAQLLGELVGGHQGGNLARRGWSGAQLDDSDMECDRFLPMQSAGGGSGANPMTDSCMSSASGGSVTSSLTGITSHAPRNRRVPQIDGDPTAEVSHINIRMASCSCILLHRDILIPTIVIDECLQQSSIVEMQNMSSNFFENLGVFAVSGFGNKDFDTASEIFDKATNNSHLRLNVTSITLDACEKSTSQGCQTTGHVTLARAALKEILYYDLGGEPSEHEAIDILTFVHQVEDSEETEMCNPLGGLPDVKIHFKVSQKAIRFAGEKKLSNPITDISVDMAEACVEVDLRLYERVGSFHRTNSSFDSGETQSNAVSFDMRCPKLNIILRFPASELPKRAVREDAFRINACGVHVHNHTPIHSHTTIQLMAQQLDAYYVEHINDEGIHIARATADENATNTHSDIFTHVEKKMPCLTLTLRSLKTQKGAFECSSDEDTTPNPSMFQSAFLMDKVRDKTHPSPFSSKKISHQSDTPHEQLSNVEELLVPGSASEIMEFTSYSTENSYIHLQCDLPVLSMQFQSKQLYELIYNRINYDLLMWEPDIPNNTSTLANKANEPNIYPAFALCKSGLDYASASESSSSSEEDDNVFFSTYQKSRIKQSLTDGNATQASSHDFCMTLFINKAMLTFYVPVRDSENKVVPMQSGEAALIGGDISLCSVSGVRGEYGTALMSLLLNTATLYHCDIIPETIEKPVKLLRLFGSTLPSYLLKTIYPSAKETRLKHGASEILRLGLSVEPHKDLSNFKKIRVSLDIEGATMRHRRQKDWWLMQLLDVLDVQDFGPVTPALTELHAHLRDVAIDYRPLYLPTRVVLTLGTFSVSSNVIANTNTSNLRFIAQECSLFLHEVTGCKPGDAAPQEDNVSVNLQKNYVCVMDLGLFELSLRLVEKRGNTTLVTGPSVDVRASNNLLSVRTCCDSASALCRLISYLAADGDRPPDNVDENPLEDIREMSQNDVSEVNNLMEEAMEEYMNDKVLSDTEEHMPTNEKEGVEVFFFPDESTNKTPKRSSISSENNLENSTECSDEDRVSLKRGSVSSDSTERPKEWLEFKLCSTLEEFLECAPNHKEEKDEESTNAVEEIEDKSETAVSPSNEEDGVSEDVIQTEINLHFAEEEKKKREDSQPLISQVITDLGDIQSELDEMMPKRQQKTSEGGGSTDEEFCIIDTRTPQDEELTEPTVRWYQPDPVPFHTNHFSLPLGKTDVLRPPNNFPTPLIRYTLCEMTVVWHIYGGYDFKKPVDERSGTGKKVTVNESCNTYNSTVRHEPDLYDVVPRTSPRARITYNSARGGGKYGVHYSAGTRQTPTVNRQAPNTACSGVARDKDLHVEIEFSKVKFLHESYPNDTKQASRQTLAIGRVEVRDRVAASTIDKLLSHYVDCERPTQTHANMVVMKAVHLRPNPTLAMQECCVKLSLLPLRFHIDQDTLLFLINFFSNLDPESDSTNTEEKSPRRSSQQLPVMQVNRQNIQQSDSGEPMIEQYEAERLVSDNLIQLEEEFKSLGVSSTEQADDTSSTSSAQTSDDLPIYFRRVVFSPDVAIRVDYVGKRVDLSQGPIAGLLLGLAHLNCSELTLKRLCHRHGILGVDRLLKWALGEWLSDIKRRQLPGLLGGIGPMHSLLQLLSGVRDLIWLPVAQWRTDGRVAYGLRRGAASFSARAALAALDLTARLLAVVQAAAETALHVLSPAGTTHATTSRRRRRRAAGGDLRAAAAGACAELRAGLAEQAGRVAEARGGVAVLRALPAAAVAPLALAAAASADLLVAVRAHIAPDLAARNHKPDQD